MPIDSSLFYQAHTDPEQELESDEPPKGWWKEEFDRRRGRHRRDRVTTTIDQMIGEQQRIARSDGTSNDR
jgi:hypothetical protein|tara:strand:- start:1004 stop:1213 length:210 start_codon:yes stop_codon:yes gene_type:complete